MAFKSMLGANTQILRRNYHWRENALQIWQAEHLLKKSRFVLLQAFSAINHFRNSGKCSATT